MHLRREEEVISADDGNAESGRSAVCGRGCAARVAAARLGAGGWPEGVGHLHVLEAPIRIRKPSRERRGGSFGGSAKDAHGE